MSNRKLFGLLAVAILFSGCGVSDQITGLLMALWRSFLFVAPLLAGLIGLIFLLNRFILDSRGRTNDQLVSIIGVIVFPLILNTVFYFKWDTSWISISVATVAGLIIGWFSYTIDELLIQYWENKRITIPGTIGLLFGGVIISSFFTGVWLEGKMYITHKACAGRVVVERYSEDCSTDSDGTYSCTDSWDYVTHVDRIVEGWELPKLIEGRDYVLGYGDNSKPDRIRKENYYFIGGQFYSERRNMWSDFRWLRLENKTSFDIGEVQIVRSNYFGNPVESGGYVSAPIELPSSVVASSLSAEEYLPPPTLITKMFSITLETIKQMFAEHEYRSVLIFFACLFALLAILAVFIPQTRLSVYAFIIGFFVIAVLIVMIAASRMGAIGGMSFNRGRRTGGGGGFGGRSWSR